MPEPAAAAAPVTEEAKPADHPAETKPETPKIESRRDKIKRIAAEKSGAKAAPAEAAPADGQAPDPNAPPAQAEPPKPEDPEKEALDRAFAGLKVERRKLKERREREDAREAALNAREQAMNDRDKLFDTDPHAYMRKHGLSFDALARKALESEESPEQKAQRERDERLARLEEADRKRLEEDQKRSESESERIRQQGHADGIKQASAFLDENAANFPLIHARKERGFAKEAWRRIFVHYEKTGEQLDAYDVFEDIEKDLADLIGTASPKGASERGNGAVQPAKPEAAEAPKVVSKRDTVDRSSQSRHESHRERVNRVANRHNANRLNTSH